jgi:hypothetical protein
MTSSFGVYPCAHDFPGCTTLTLPRASDKCFSREYPEKISSCGVHAVQIASATGFIASAEVFATL